MVYLGYRPASSVVEIFFTTHAATGASVAPLTAFEAADVILYKGHSATQRTSQAGWTMTSPFDSIVGLHQLSIDLSDNTDAGFYAAGSHYTAVLSPDTETVDGLTVVAVLAEFDIGPADVNLTQILGTAAATPATAGILDVNVKNAANVAWGSGAITAASIATDAITAAKIAADAIGASELAADAVTEINAAIVALLPTALVGGRMDSSVGAMASGVLTATAIAADAITAAKIAADALGASELAADAATEIATAVWAAATRTLSALGFTLSATDLASGTITAAKFAAGAIDAAAIAADAIGASELASDAVTEIQSGLSTLTAAGVRTAVGLASANLDTQLDALPTAAENADAVWDEATSGHVTAGSTGKALTDASSAGTPPTAAAIATEVWDTVIESTETALQQLRLIRAAAAGKLNGAGSGSTTIHLRDKADTKNRVTATVDADGNRTAVTVDVS